MPGLFICAMCPASDNVLNMSSSATDQTDQAARALEKQVWDSIGSNKIRRAVSDCEQLNRQFPAFASGWHTASHLALKLNKASMALAAIDKALAIEPDSAAWLLQRGLCLLKLGRMASLKELVGRLGALKVETAYQLSALGTLLNRMGEHEQAIAPYEKAAKLEPDRSKHFYNLACTQRSLGRVADAERNFDETIRLNPADYEAIKVRSELRKQSPDDNHVEELETLLEAGIADPRGRVNICFALAKELEDLGESQRSFHYLKIGADTRRSLMQYDVQRDLETMASIRQTYGPDLFDGSIEGDNNSEAIFILGMPRTGTTLVERILSSHTDVFAAGELNNFAVQMTRLVKESAGNRNVSREQLVEMSAGIDFKKLGQAYVDSTRPFTGHTAHFIDKLPLNYLYIGLIHLALPNAKIVSLERHPLDTCYAIYKQLFLDAYPFSYDLEELGRYYVAYHQLMEHWNSVLPGVIHTVRYENLVADLEADAQQLIEFCGLDWQPQCLKFYENPNASTTASTVQVRQPVYQSSVGKWRNYREQLAPLIAVFEAAGIPLDG